MNDANVRNLRVQDEYLELLREEFGKMLAKKHFSVDTFQEGLRFNGVRGLNGKVRDNFPLFRAARLTLES